MSYKKELVAYRRTRAREVLEDAKILLGSKRFYSTVNRIYYAMFYGWLEKADQFIKELEMVIETKEM